MDSTLTDLRPISLVELIEQAQDVKPSKVYPPGRACKRWACITILSRYDKGPECYAHSPDEVGALLGTVA